MEEKRCLTCRYGDLPSGESPCKECIKLHDNYEKYWEPKEPEEPEEQKRLAADAGAGIQMKGVEKMEDRECTNCKYGDLTTIQSPCSQCIVESMKLEAPKYWEPKEAEDKEKKEEKGKKEIELKKRPEMLAFPVPIYEHTDSEIPEKVRISFTNGTSAIYMLHVDQQKPMVMESIRIIRKWRSEGYQDVPQRRRRNRK